MAVRRIITLDSGSIRGVTDSVLAADNKQVTTFSCELEQIVTDLRDTLRSDTLSVGLAAPQIGYNVAVAIININKEKDERDDLLLVNPVVIGESGQKDVMYESCMSIPHKRGQVQRRKKVAIRYQDELGNKKELNASGFLARVIMHEVDHLNGVLFTQRMKDEDSLEETELFREHGVN